MIQVLIDTSKLNTISRRVKAQVVSEEMEIILNSEEFRFCFLEKLNSRAFEKGELSEFRTTHPSVLLDYLLSGAERLDKTEDSKINIEIDDYYSLKRVIGYTYPYTRTIFVNTKYFDKNSSMLIGSNLLHEYGHKLGFSHDFFNTKKRKDSLCYLLNEVYEQVHNSFWRKC